MVVETTQEITERRGSLPSRLWRTERHMETERHREKPLWFLVWTVLRFSLSFIRAGDIFHLGALTFGVLWS